MYLQHFGLSDRPFRIVPSPRYFFLSETHDEGRARILYGIRENRGFVVVTGGVGLGKTTVLLSVVNELEDEMDIAIIVNPIDSFEQLLRMICDELGVTVRDADEATLLAHLNTSLLNSYAKGRGCVLMLDEAQNLSIEVLEKVRTLSNLQTEDASLLQIVLLGQPELTQKLNDHRLRQLRQRIGVWHEIRALQAGDTVDYVWHRLALSGAVDPRAIAPRQSCQVIHEYAQGIPRLINQLSDTALVVAYGEGSRSIQSEHVHEAARELRLVAEEEEATDPKPIRRARPSRPARSRRRRWLIAALIALILVVITGAAWTQFSDSFGAGPLAAEPEPEVGAVSQSQPEETATQVGGSAEPANVPAVAPPRTTTGEPAPVLSAQAAEILRRYRAVEELRGRGPVYAIHLGSFRSEADARHFARDLVSAHSGWAYPLYVLETSDQPAWYRVSAGGYADRAEAVAQARKLKSDLELLYAQLTQLKPGARALLLGSLKGAEVAENNE